MEGIEKFLQGRYGFDGLACGLVFLSLIINLVTFLVPVPALHRWNFLCFVPLVFCVLRMFSRSTEKRSRENERFLRIFASFFSLFDKEEQESESGRQSTGYENRDTEGRQTVGNEGSRQSTVNESRTAEDRQSTVNESHAAEDRQNTANESRTAARSSDTSYRRGGRVDKKEQAQLFRFFKCPACSQRIRVPRGKGKVEITCPKCGNRFIKKT